MLAWLLKDQGRRADLSGNMQCNEEIDDDNVSISSKRPPISSEGRPTKRMRATNLPAVKVSSISHYPLPLFLALPIIGLVCCQAGLQVIAWVHAFSTTPCVWYIPNQRNDFASSWSNCALLLRAIRECSMEERLHMPLPTCQSRMCWCQMLATLCAGCIPFATMEHPVLHPDVRLKPSDSHQRQPLDNMRRMR